MNSQRAARLVLLSASSLLFSQAIYAQTIAYPMVPKSSATPGTYRPHIWFAPNSANLAHDPGQPACNSSNHCYLNPADILNGYATNFIQNSNGGSGITIGIVDAFYNNQTASDLASYSAYYGITGTGTLTIVSQTGGAPTAAFNAGWATETNLDVQMAHALAPNANILLVTATDNTDVNLLAAVTYAVAHSDVVSNSYGGGEYAGETSGDGVYNSGVPVLFSSGDTGAVTESPCTDPYVTCVGGTNLLETATGFRSVESAWSGSGGGCSSQVTAPAFQSGYSTSVCSTARGVPDIAALADPYTGVANYWGSNIGSSYSGAGMYCCIGGTSLATPLTAALIANIDAARVAAAKAKLGSNLNQLIYQAAAGAYYHYRFYDVTTGSSGFAAVAGWDRATGLGVPLSAALASYLVNIVP
jgi:subtilase family serine protease